ncbi:MAG: CPBP family glutamic-type intramembrane protease [Planctomycetota bacterium]|nr:CPBP family glutamic-type intramembrane protease [Planctomycetota bacterium]MDG1983637.1 CPBP family glutamic-type intramembrane protease [Planctomycetota bacterium]
MVEYDDEDDGADEEEPISQARVLSLRVDGPARGVAFGFLTMLPLFLAYELTGAGEPGQPRAVAEAILCFPLSRLGAVDLVEARRIGLGALAVAALIAFQLQVRREHGAALGPRFVRTLLEGLIGALVLGPVLFAASEVASPYVGTMTVGAGSGAGLGATAARAGFVIGGAAYEEIVFRLGALSLLWLLSKRCLTWLGAVPGASRLGAVTLASVGSAALFAAFHLQTFTAWLGPGGEPYDAAVFTWRATAGVLLAALFLWRGIGVAAWSHAFFNLALLVGALPR